MNNGLWVSPTEFVSFAQQTEPLATTSGAHIATRLAAGDVSSWFGLLPNPDPILKQMGKQVEVYRNLLPDPLVMGARDRRIGALQSMERGFDPEQSKGTPARVLKALELIVSELDIDRISEDLIDGAFFGYRVAEVMWESRRGMPTPIDLVAKPSEWFAFEPEGARLKFKPRTSMQGVDVPVRKFVTVGRKRNWENPYGEPQLAACFWPVTFKRAGLKFWVTFTEKYGMPWSVGKLPRTASQAEHDDLAARLAAMVRDAVATVPDDSSVELMTVASSSNAELYRELLMYCRGEITISLLGNNQSVEKEANRASAQAAQAVEKHVRSSDAKMVAGGINQVIRYTCEANWPGVVPPVYAFWEQEEVDEALAKRDETLKKAGANLTRTYWMRAYQLEESDLAADTAPGTERNAGTHGAPGPDDEAASFADPEADDVPADQAALDAAIAQLPAEAVQAAMRRMLDPALKAIEAASTPDEVRQALLDAWPEMDASGIEDLLARAFFVADLVGRDSVLEEKR